MRTRLSLLFLSALLCSSAAFAAAVPNDPFFHQQWALHNDGTQAVLIDADDLHTISQAGVAGTDIGWLDALDELSARATAPVTVAVIDSGIDFKHPDLQGRILTSDALDLLAGSPSMIDDIGHGTHVAGIIAANTGNSAGIAGIAPASVKILPLKILTRNTCKNGQTQNCMNGFTYNGKFISDYAADAIRYAVAHGATIINMSLGWPKFLNTDSVRSAVADAVGKGVLIVAAAGNDRKDEPTYPCAFEGVLCVGSVSNNGAMAVYSNSGGNVDLLAPGDSIVSTYPSNVESSALRIQGYEQLSGTSQASPMVAGIAAVLRSAMPSISLSELKARLFASGAALPYSGSALYGLAHLKRALDAQPRPVLVPDFKPVDEFVLDEATLGISGTIALQSLWQATGPVQARVTVNGQPAGSAQATSLGQGASLSIPWSYRFASLEDSSDVEIELSVSGPGLASQTFGLRTSAARPMQSLAGTRSIPVAGAGSWIGSVNGNLFSRLSAVSSTPAETGLPRFFQQQGYGPLGSLVQVFDPAGSPQVFNVPVPAIQRCTQVLRMDSGGTGARNWVFVGLGQNGNVPFLQFYFLDASFKPLWGTDAASTWQMDLNIPMAQTINRDYSTASSWVRGADGKLVPAFLAPGSLPDPDNFDRLDPRHYKADTHLYYLQPQSLAAGAKAIKLQLRALDGKDFRQKNPLARLRNAVPHAGLGAEAGHLQILLGLGTDLNAPTQLWDIHSLVDTRLSAANGWDSLSSTGQPLIGLTPDPTATQPLFLSFFDPTRGSLSWATPDGSLQQQDQFTYSSPENGIAGLIGAFAVPGEGHVWFLETRFDIVAYHVSAPGAAPETQVLPIERDSTFPGQQFSEMFTPVVVGSSGSPEPGVYIDSTLVRGNRVSVALWNGEKSRFEKPLRYSLEVPAGCVEMAPAYLDSRVESFSLPLLCGQGGQTQLRLAVP